MSSNRLSFSAINTYTQCGKKYELRYNKRLRSKWFHAALAYGSAVDAALNELLLTKDVNKAKAVFDKNWSFQWVNKKYVPLSQYTELVYAETDFDAELLKDADWEKLEIFLKETKLDYTLHSKELVSSILKDKKTNGWDNLREDQRKFYNYAHWLCMSNKGHYMLDSYVKRVLPNIIEVLAVQKENSLANGDGDTVIQYLDLIVTWKDGRNVLFDNKTSAREYEQDSASRSAQLISYYHGAKEEYKLDAVGFIVLRKNLLKNKIKICSVCGHDGSGGRHKTCDNEIDGKRCDADWLIKINPECDIQVIINNVAKDAEDLILETFDDANIGIKNKIFHRNLGACKNGPIVCEYLKYCWGKDASELVEVSKDEKK